jgi:hypothetical protein
MSPEQVEERIQNIYLVMAHNGRSFNEVALYCQDKPPEFYEQFHRYREFKQACEGWTPSRKCPTEAGWYWATLIDPDTNERYVRKSGWIPEGGTGCWFVNAIAWRKIEEPKPFPAGSLAG